jgi:hypothetical protein
MADLQEWIKTISGFSAVILAAVAINQYRLNNTSENRLRESTRADIDVRLLTSFSDVMRIAVGRANPVISEACVGKMFATFSQSDLRKYAEEVRADPGDADAGLPIPARLRGCVIFPLQGVSAQAAAITSIAVLGCRYSVLRASAITALKSLGRTEEAAVSGLQLLNQHECDTEGIPRSLSTE